MKKLLGILISICLLFCEANSVSSIFRKAKTPPISPSIDPFSNLAQFLVRFDKDSDLSKYSLKQISSAIKVLSKSQSAIKTMDGVTHQFRNVMKESSSLDSRVKKFLLSKRKRLKEAAKVYEYTTAVERAMQAAEIIQIVTSPQNIGRTQLYEEAGLKQLKRSIISVGKLKLVVTVLQPIQDPTINTIEKLNISNNIGSDFSKFNSINKQKRSKSEVELERKIRSMPVKYQPNELIIAVTEVNSKDTAKNIAQLLRLASQESKTSLFHSDDGVGIEVQPTLALLACKVVNEMREFIIPGIETSSSSATNPFSEDGIIEDKNNHLSTTSTSTTNSSALAKDNNIDMQVNRKKDSIYITRRSAHTVQDESLTTTPPSTTPPSITPPNIAATVDEMHHASVLPSSLRFVGHSTGGAVAALAAIILDGEEAPMHTVSSTMTQEDLQYVSPELSPTQQQQPQKGLHTATSVAQSLQDEPTSLTNQGDSSNPSLLQQEGVEDCVGVYSNRVHCTALGPPPCLTRTRVPRYIQSFICGDDLIPRAQYSTLTALRVRVLRALKAGAGRGGNLGYILSAGLVTDLSTIAGLNARTPTATTTGTAAAAGGGLSVPGRVFFIKPRKLKKGATIQRVLRGNWQEDVLWQLHEVLISNRMMEHHSLDSYIRTLNRC